MTTTMPHRHRRWPAVTLMIIGAALVIIWSFRTYIIFLNAPGDTFLVPHALVTLVSLIAAVLLIRIGRRAYRAQPLATDTRWLAAIGLWFLGVGANRFVLVTTQPSHDPDPRAHLHLAVSFLVLGLLLLIAAWHWKQQRR